MTRLSSGIQPIQEGSNEWEYFLLRLRYREGRLLDLAGNNPILLDSDNWVWVVYAGKVDIFWVAVNEEGEPGARHYLFTAEPGFALFGTTPNDQSIRLMACGASRAQVLRVRRSSYAVMAREPEYRELAARLLDNWLTGLTAGIFPELPPKKYQTLAADQELSLTADETARGRREVIWVAHREGRSLLNGRPEFALTPDERPLPLTHSTWLLADGPTRLTAAATTEILQQENGWDSVEAFHLLLAQLLGRVALDTADHEAAIRQSRLAQERRHIERGLTELSAILQPDRAALTADLDGQDALLAACQLVAEADGIAIRQHPDALTGKAQLDPLGDIVRASRIRFRQVTLTDDWWRQDNGSLLGFLSDDQRPVALLPVKGGYCLRDPQAETAVPVTAETAASLQPEAFVFYRPLPHKTLQALDLLRFGLRHTFRDAWSILIFGLAAGLTALTLPILTSVIFDAIIPAADKSQLLPVALALGMSAVAMALFEAARGVALLRLETRVEGSLQAAVIDRLISLPAPFYRDFSAGDLGERAMGISVMREVLARTALTAVLAAIFSIFSFIILFFYDAQLAWVATGLVLALFSIVTLFSYKQTHYQRALVAAQGELSGIVLQFISGVAKLRVAGAERRAFSRWAARFAEQRTLGLKARLIGGQLITVNQVYNLLAMMVIFGVIGLSTQTELSTGAFLAFNAAFAQFVLAALGVSGALTALVTIVPLYERAKPILQTLPEGDNNKAHPGELTGRIEVSRLTFRYEADGPIILDNISLDFASGEFIALVGPSGSGKSTLLRMLLGFEKPESGAILYDGQELTELDVQAVRRQLGVVLQNGKLQAGTIFSNIVGSMPLTLDDAWQAAELTGLADDVKRMPMGMHTVISEGAGTLSGGQRQRLLIARAIVHRPRILFFDEATSALDNRTQEIVSRSLEELEATRIVIAHRLSTIQNADRIYVLRDGRVVQQGTYRQLIAQRGPFADLARRQMA